MVMGLGAFTISIINGKEVFDVNTMWYYKKGWFK